MAQNTSIAVKKLPYTKTVTFCGGCVKGKCFPPEDGALVWAHLKSYRRKDEYKNVLLVQATCLSVCAGGPILQVLDQNGIIQYSLHAKSIEEAKNLVDRIMEEHVLCDIPVQEFLEHEGEAVA